MKVIAGLPADQRWRKSLVASCIMESFLTTYHILTPKYNQQATESQLAGFSHRIKIPMDLRWYLNLSGERRLDYERYEITEF